MALTQVPSGLLANTGVTPGTYGGTSNAAVIVVNAEGQITSASNVAVSASGAGTVANNTMLLYSNTINVNYTVNSGNNALSVGPIAVANGISVSLSSGQRWVII